MYIAKSVQESGSHSGECRLLLETEKSAHFQKVNVIAKTCVLDSLPSDKDTSQKSLFLGTTTRIQDMGRY
jgi:hypothetical protein